MKQALNLWQQPGP